MKTVHVKSALPIYIAAAVWLLAGLILPKFLLGVPGLLVTAAISAGAGLISRSFFPGRDVQVEEKIATGDAALDSEIQRGRARLDALRRANGAIDNPQISSALNRMTRAGEQVFKELGREPKKAALVRRFMNYYLPTTEKLVETYRQLMGTETKGRNIQSAMGTIESSMGLVADAFEKCADNLFADTEMDVDAEIKVLRTMLAGDDLIRTESPSDAIEEQGQAGAMGQ